MFGMQRPKVSHILAIKGRCLRVPCRPCAEARCSLWLVGWGVAGVEEEEEVFTLPHGPLQLPRIACQLFLVLASSAVAIQVTSH